MLTIYFTWAGHYLLFVTILKNCIYCEIDDYIVTETVNIEPDYIIYTPIETVDYRNKKLFYFLTPGHTTFLRKAQTAQTAQIMINSYSKLILWKNYLPIPKANRRTLAIDTMRAARC